MALGLQHGHHVFSLFGKTVLFAINKAWIKLLFVGDTSFYVFFVVEYQFSAWTAFSLDTWNFHQTRTCHLSCLSSLASQLLCNIFNHDNRTPGLITLPLQSIS